MLPRLYAIAFFSFLGCQFCSSQEAVCEPRRLPDFEARADSSFDEVESIFWLARGLTGTTPIRTTIESSKGNPTNLVESTAKTKSRESQETTPSGKLNRVPSEASDVVVDESDPASLNFRFQSNRQRYVNRLFSKDFTQRFVERYSLSHRPRVKTVIWANGDGNDEAEH